MATARHQSLEWLHAMRWRKRVEEVLGPSGLTFTQWLVLDATRELFRATEDAVSHAAVAAHLEMHRATVSDAMIALDRRGLVDRGCSFEGPAWRVILTSEAKALLARLDPLIDVASRAN